MKIKLPKFNVRYFDSIVACAWLERGDSIFSDRLNPPLTDFTPFWESYRAFLIALRQTRRMMLLHRTRTIRPLRETAETPCKDDIARFAEEVYKGVRAGQIDRTIDFVFEEIDGRLNRSDFAGCGDILRRLNVPDLGSDLIVAFLVITLPAKGEIGPSRLEFFDRSKVALSRSHQPKEVEEILEGLE